MKKVILGVLGSAVIFGAAAADNSPLYDDIEVLGALDCAIDGDIRLIVGTERFLHCDYESRGAPDELKRYAGYVRDVEEGRSATSGDFACWTVLQLDKNESAERGRGAFKGSYVSAPAATINKYKLKAGALIGGRKQQFALEPRCVAPRSGDNVADMILRFENSD